jgi:FkbM family methyltransferase
MSNNYLAVTHKANVASYLAFLKILPAIVLNVKNWVQFLKAYSDGYKGEIEFRDGFKLFVDDASDISSVSTSFFRKDYGTMDSSWKTIVDIGAHKGFFTTYAAKNCPHAQIFSYEPIPSSFAVLAKNVHANNLEDLVAIFNMGVAGTAGDKEINISSSSTDNSFYTEIGSIMTGKLTISCTTLTDILSNNNIAEIALLKLDCEGAEFEILMSSSKETLQRVKEMRMEYHNINDQKNIAVLTEFLENSGFICKEQSLSNNPNIGYARFLRNA